jgi:hypothetical protein
LSREFLFVYSLFILKKTYDEKFPENFSAAMTKIEKASYFGPTREKYLPCKNTFEQQLRGYLYKTELHHEHHLHQNTMRPELGSILFVSHGMVRRRVQHWAHKRPLLGINTIRQIHRY